MIKLKVKPYCDNCPHFLPDVEKSELAYSGKSDFITEIFCEHRRECEEIRRYLESKSSSGDSYE